MKTFAFLIFFFSLHSALPIFTCFASAQRISLVDEYVSCLDRLSNIAFNSEYSSNDLGKAGSLVLVKESWKVDFKRRSSWKRSVTSRHQGLSYEMLAGNGLSYGLTVQASNETATAFTSWSMNRDKYWLEDTGFGNLGVVFGYIWNGKGYYSIAEFVRFGEASVVDSVATIKFSDETFDFEGHFDLDKGFCPIRIEFRERLGLANDQPENGIVQTTEFGDPQQIDGIWIASDYRVATRAPTRRQMLPKGLKIVNGSAVIDANSSIQEYIELPAISLDTKVKLSEVVFSTPLKFEFEAKVPEKMKVSMQDLSFLPHKWDGKMVVPVIDDEFQKQAAIAVFKSNSKQSSAQSKRWFIVVSSIFTILGLGMFIGRLLWRKGKK